MSCISQIFNIKPNLIDKPTFENNLSGVKYAFYDIDLNTVELMKQNKQGSNFFVYQALESYLSELGFEKVLNNFNPNVTQGTSFCDLVTIHASWNYTNKFFSNIILDFYFCNGDMYTFTSNKKIFDTMNSEIWLYFIDEFNSMYSKVKAPFRLENRKKLPSFMSEWNELYLKNYLDKNKLNPIEGIYEGLSSDEMMPKYKFGIVKNKEIFDIIYYSGAPNFEDWEEGEIKGTIEYTAVPNIYKVDWKGQNKFRISNYFLSYENGILKLFNDKENYNYIKLFPKSIENKSDNISLLKSTGTGFAINTNGLIVTNYHVIQGANQIKIRGIKGNLDNSYFAKVLLADEKNDLAILEINDPAFNSLDKIPYLVSNRPKDVGTKIFVLGYPLPSTMGTEIKLTDGIISAKTGFKGDASSFQVSAPVQPGNSGGPLFLENGEIIGIINSKHLNTDNVSYAIKPSLLFGLLETLDNIPEFPSINSLKDMPLTEKVKIMKKFIYLIEVY